MKTIGKWLFVAAGSVAIASIEAADPPDSSDQATSRTGYVFVLFVESELKGVQPDIALTLADFEKKFGQQQNSATAGRR